MSASDVDTTLIRELQLYIMNTAPLYNQLEAFRKNYQQKIAKGIFSRDLGIQGLQNNLVPRAIQEYKKEVDQALEVSTDEKRALAELLLDDMLKEIGGVTMVPKPFNETHLTVYGVGLQIAERVMGKK